MAKEQFVACVIYAMTGMGVVLVVPCFIMSGRNCLMLRCGSRGSAMPWTRVGGMAVHLVLLML